MTVIIDGTTGISTPGEAVSGNISYTGTLTGGTGVVDLGSGQVYKDASGNVGIGTSSPAAKLESLVTSTSTPSLRLRYNAASYYFDASMDGNGNTVLMVPAANGVTSGNLLFGAGGAERARIDSSGNLLVGKADTSTAVVGTAILPTATAGFIASFTSDAQRAVIANRLTNDGDLISMRRSSVEVGRISVTSSATSYNTSSDYRLKEQVQPMTGALTKVAELKPVTYKWKVDGSDGEGFIAHELQEVCPDAVTGEKDAVDADGNPQYQGIDTSFLIATLSAAIQELHALVKTQAEDIAALKAKLP